MASLTRRSDSRAQLILVTALAVAAMLVALTIILNSAIYTQNLASRTGPMNTDATKYHSEVVRGSAAVLEYANEYNGSSSDAVSENFTAGVADLSEAAGYQRAVRGQSVDVEVVSHVNGSRVVQDDRNRDFTDKNGQSDWTVVSGVHKTDDRSFVLNVSVSELPDDCGVVGGCFRLNVTEADASNNWTVQLRKVTNSEIELAVYNGSGWVKEQFDAPNGYAVIDVRRGIVNGQRHSEFEFAENVSGTVHYQYRAADEVVGSYSISVDDEGPAKTPGTSLNGTASTDSPYVRYSVNEATVEITYRSDRIRYESEDTVLSEDDDV
jgi:hypothetical protein